MLVFHPFSLALGLVMLAISALGAWGSLWNLRHPQPEVRWWVPTTMSVVMLVIGLGRVSAAFDPGTHMSTRTLALDWVAGAVALVALPFFLVSLLRSRRAKSAGAAPPAA